MGVMNVINGSEIARKILSELKQEVKKLSFQPLFCDILIGDDSVSQSYVKLKAKRAKEIGLKFELITLPQNVSASEVLEKISEIQKNPHLAGLIVQLPLPQHLDRDQILNAIRSEVDVDSLGAINTELFYAGKSKILPPTAAAVITVLDSLELDLKQKQFLVVGQGELVGKPVAYLLKQKGFNVKTADDKTENLKKLLLNANVIIAGAGHPGLITGDQIKSGVILIDCGTSESAGSIVGDIDTESVLDKASFLSAVPGGVGPVTVAMLLKNVVEAACMI
jgi:methylenetetrahydrofolate dehydrogenase (NADP+)/methenyltetrahydrofolate cyclohydrolase